MAQAMGSSHKNDAAPEGRNTIVRGFNVPPLRGWCGARPDTLQIFRRSAASSSIDGNLFI